MLNINFDNCSCHQISSTFINSKFKCFENERQYRVCQAPCQCPLISLILGKGSNTTYVVYYTTKAVYYTTNVVQYTTFVVYNFIIFLDFNLKHHGKHSRIVYIFGILQIFFQIQSRNIIKLYSTNVVYYTTFVVQYTTYVVSYTTFVVYKHCIVYCICSILYNICGIHK